MIGNNRFHQMSPNRKRKKMRLCDNVKDAKKSLQELNEELELFLNEPQEVVVSIDAESQLEQLELLLNYFKEIPNGFDVILTLDNNNTLINFMLSKDVANISEEAKSVITAILNKFNNYTKIGVE